MKLNSFISVILTVACSLMFVACSDWTEPTPVDYNPIFPDEQDPSLHEKYEQSLKEYKNRKHTLMLYVLPTIRVRHWANRISCVPCPIA